MISPKFDQVYALRRISGLLYPLVRGEEEGRGRKKKSSEGEGEVVERSCWCAGLSTGIGAAFVFNKRLVSA